MTKERRTIEIATFNSVTLSFSGKRTFYAPVALKEEAIEKFQAYVQAQYYVWFMQEAVENKEDLLRNHPFLGKSDNERTFEEKREAGTEAGGLLQYKYDNLLYKIEAGKDYTDITLPTGGDYGSLVLKAIDKASSLGGFDTGVDKTYILFYASFVSGRRKMFLNKEYEGIHKLMKILFYDYFLTDEPNDSIHKDKYFKQLKDELVSWYNKHFGLNEGEETELFTSKGSRLAKVSASDVKVLIAGMKGNSKIESSTGKVRNASFKSKIQGGQEFKLFMLRKVQRISLDEERALYGDCKTNNSSKEEPSKTPEKPDYDKMRAEKFTAKCKELYNNMSFEKLRKCAKTLEIKGYTEMKKGQLVEACTKATKEVAESVEKVDPKEFRWKETTEKAEKVASKKETAKNVEAIDAKEETVKEETEETVEAPNYNAMTVKELKEHAKTLEIKGYTEMKKGQLVEACTKATNKEETAK